MRPLGISAGKQHMKNSPREKNRYTAVQCRNFPNKKQKKRVFCGKHEILCVRKAGFFHRAFCVDDSIPLARNVQVAEFVRNVGGRQMASSSTAGRSRLSGAA